MTSTSHGRGRTCLPHFSSSPWFVLWRERGSVRCALGERVNGRKHRRWRRRPSCFVDRIHLSCFLWKASLLRPPLPTFYYHHHHCTTTTPSQVKKEPACRHWRRRRPTAITCRRNTWTSANCQRPRNRPNQNLPTIHQQPLPAIPS